MSTQLSVKTIYASLSVLSRGTLRSELLTALRQARTVRWPRARGTDRHGQIPHMTPIAERPAEVATHTVPGHWEGDRIKGARKGSAVEALVEGTTRLVIRSNNRNGCAECLQGLHENTPACAHAAAPNLDLRSRKRDGRAPTPGGAAGDSGVL